tara:strand:+ start:151 stop:444 length:294 start_codon:yes stop_codon:yes gene_type:complete
MSEDEVGWGISRTYIAPIPKIKATDIFVLMFICKFHIKNTGRMAIVQSVQHETAEYPYVAETVMFGSIHVPFPPVYRVQKYALGRHWRTKRKKKKVP